MAGNPSWVKGKSGNPGGRPKGILEIQRLARDKCPEAIKLALSIMRNKKADDRARIEAAKVILDRGMGKPSQPVEVDARVAHSFDSKSTDELLALLKAAREAQK